MRDGEEKGVEEEAEFIKARKASRRHTQAEKSRGETPYFEKRET